MADETIYADENASDIYRLVNGHVGQPDWTQERNGVGCSTVAGSYVTVDCRDTGGDWSFLKSFLRFDLSSLSGGSWDSAKIHIKGYSSKMGDGDIVLTKGYQGNPVVTANWSTHLATEGEISRRAIADWVQNVYLVFTLNATGDLWVAEKLGNILKICLRQSYDYEDDEASATDDGGNANFFIPYPASPEVSPKLVLENFSISKAKSRAFILA